MKLVLALALSLPALAGAMGMATREPMDSQTNEAPNGQYCSFCGWEETDQVNMPYINNGPDCWDACVAELGDDFASVDYNDNTGCFCQITCACKGIWGADKPPLYLATANVMIDSLPICACS